MEELFALIRSKDVTGVERALVSNPQLARDRHPTSSFTALHFAASVGDEKVVSLLLAHPLVDKAALTLGGKSYLDIAKTKGFVSRVFVVCVLTRFLQVLFQF